MKSLTLVQFKDELFPRSEADFEFLKSRQVTVFRIPVSLLDYLKETLLKKVPIKIIDFPSVYKEGMLKFQSAVLETKSIRSKMEKNTVLMGYNKSDLEYVNSACARLSTQLGRFGFKVVRENKPDHKSPDSKVVTRLEVIADPDINPSYHFGDFISEFTENSIVNLSNSARICFKSRASKLNPGKTTFCLDFQDKFGDEWQTAFSRAFDLVSLDREQVSLLINQFMHLSNTAEHYTPPVTPKSRN